MNIYRMTIIFLLSLILQNCIHANPEYNSFKKNKKEEIKVEYGLILAQFLNSTTLTKYFCDEMDFNIETNFNVDAVLKGALNSMESPLNLLSCEHWSESPFNDPPISNMKTLKTNQWLILYVHKRYGNLIIEKRPVFQLQNKANVFCNVGELIGALLKTNNSNFGEYIGEPILINNDYEKELYIKSPCYNVRDSYAYYENFVKLK